MRLREILKLIADSGTNEITSRSLAILMNIPLPTALVYMTRLYRRGWISRQRTNLARGGYIYTCRIAPKGAEYLAYMSDAQQPKLRIDQVFVAGLIYQNIMLKNELDTALDENIGLQKELAASKAEIVKKDNEISRLKSDEFLWLAYCVKIKNDYDEALSLVNQAIGIMRMQTIFSLTNRVSSY